MSVAGVRRRPLAVTLLGLLGLVGSLGGQAVAASADSATAVVLVIDASGTMGKTDVAPDRMTAAKAAAHTVIGAADTPAMGLLTYGTSTGNAAGDKAAGCQDVTTVVPVAALSSSQRIALLDGVDALTPSGYTPIGLAIQRAAEAVGGRGSVVLISDGEDTCAPPDPCQVARDLKQQHPDLSISTIGFRTDQAARSQLACIASATGGLFVSADDPSQLTRRLGVATEAATGTVPLTTTGFGGIEIGRTHAEITLDHPDFPGRSAAKRYVGPVPGDLVVIRYRDCDFVFDQSGTLLAVQPTQATTVDSVGVDDTVALAVATYGPPLSTGPADDGVTAYFRADPAAGTSYRMVLSGPVQDPATRIRVIVLCRCAPQSTQLALTDTSIGEFSFDAPYRTVKQALIERFGEPDSIADFYCELSVQTAVGEQLGWGDFYITAMGPAPGEIALDGWRVEGYNTPFPVELPQGLHFGEDKDEVAAATGGTIDEMFALVHGDGYSWGYNDTTDRIDSVGIFSAACE